MEATKVTIDTGHFNVLDDKGKRKLREQKVIELIQSTPDGQTLHLKDFARVVLKTPNNASNMIQEMIKRGQITRAQSGRGFTYTVGETPTTPTTLGRPRKDGKEAQGLRANFVKLDGKTYDLDSMKPAAKRNLRRKIVLQHIQSVPAGTVFPMRVLQELGGFGDVTDTRRFILLMIRDNLIERHEGDKPRTFYYSVIGTVRIRAPKIYGAPVELDPAKQVSSFSKPDADEPSTTTKPTGKFDFTEAITNLKELGVEFTITISNKKEG